MLRRLAAIALLAAPLLLVPAAAHAEEWFEPKPPRAITIFDRAEQLVGVGQYDAAAGELATLLEAEPTNMEAYYRLGLLYHRIQRWSEAAAIAERGYRVDGKNPEMQKLWGHALVHQGRFPEAIWVLEGIVRTRPGSSLHGVFYDLAEACYGMKWYSRSQDYANRHLQLGDTPGGRAVLARALLAQGQKDKALAELTRAVSLYSIRYDAFGK